MNKHCHLCGNLMTAGPADVEETVRGIRVRMISIPAWTCPHCGEKQISLPVARYLSEYLKRLLTNLPDPPEGFSHPLTPTEVVFTAA